MSDIGLKISLPGYDVKTATPEQCSVHSSYGSPKIKYDVTPKHFGRALITFANDPPDGAFTSIFSVTHNLGYAPMFLVSGIYTDPGVLTQSGVLPLKPAATFEILAVAGPSTARIEVYWESAFGSIIGDTIDVSYYIFSENGA